MVTIDDLELVRSFVNTLDVEHDVDELGAWLVDRRARATPAAARWAREVREALRTMLLANNGVAGDVAAAAAVLDDAAARTRIALRFAADGSSRLEPAAGGVEREVGLVLAAVGAAMAEGSWSRLKACRAEDCRWAFVDRARNRSRSWCSMAVCGNRAKARTFRARHN